MSPSRVQSRSLFNVVHQVYISRMQLLTSMVTEARHQHPDVHSS